MPSHHVTFITDVGRTIGIFKYLTILEKVEKKQQKPSNEKRISKDYTVLK